MQDFLKTPLTGAPVEIVEDGGGLVSEYQRKAQQYTFERRRVEIKGSCRSACVIALSVPDVCVWPGAVVKAHHAYEKYTGVVRGDVTKQLLEDLPPKVKYVLKENISTNYNAATTLTYDELRSYGIADCRGSKPRKAEKNIVQETALDQIRKYFGK